MEMLTSEISSYIFSSAPSLGLYEKMISRFRLSGRKNLSRYPPMYLPSLCPISRIPISAHKSMRFPGVPVSPTTRFAIGLTFFRSLNLCAFGDLKLDSSSITIMSKSKNMFFVIQETLSLPMIVTSAPDRSASFLCPAVPIATANVMP